MIADRVKETTSTTGTGTVNLAGAETAFQTFVAGIGDGNTCYYCIELLVSDEWEVGIGTVTDAAPDTLSRTTVLQSSNADALVNFSAGTKDVFVVHPAEKTLYRDANGDVIVGLADGDKALFGAAGATDFSVQWDGSDAVFTITAGEFMFVGGILQVAQDADGPSFGTGVPAVGLRVSGFDDKSSSYASLTVEEHGHAVLSSTGNIYLAPGNTAVMESSASGFGLFNDKYYRFGSSGLNYAQFEWDTTQTADCLLLGLSDQGGGSVARTLLVCDAADMGYNFAHAAQANPTIFIHSANQSSDEWISLTHDQTDAVLDSGKGNLLLKAATQWENAPGHGGLILKTYGASSGTLTADHTITIQVNVPVGAKIMGAQLHVKTALAGGETWNAQYVTGATQSIGTNQAVAQDTNLSTIFDVNGATDIASGEVDITLQRNSNPGVDNFTAQGEIEAVVYALLFDTWDNE